MITIHAKLPLRCFLLDLSLFPYVLLPGCLERLGEKLLSRVPGHMPALETTDCPEGSRVNHAMRFLSEKRLPVTITNENTHPSTFGARRWLLCLPGHLVFLTFLFTHSKGTARESCCPFTMCAGRISLPAICEADIAPTGWGRLIYALGIGRIAVWIINHTCITGSLPGLDRAIASLIT